MADDDGVLAACVNHPARETGLRCNRCGDPICAQCAVRTPVGYRCKKCVREQQKTFETVRWYDFPIAFIVAAAVIGIGSLLSSVLGFWILLAAGFADRRSELGRLLPGNSNDRVASSCKRASDAQA